MRGHLHRARSTLGLLSKKRKKQYPKAFSVEVGYDPNKKSIQVPVSEHPTLIMLPMLSPPTVLAGVPDMQENNMVLAIVQTNANKPSIIQEYGQAAFNFDK